MISQLLASIRATLVLAILTGVIFPLVITVIAQTLFPDKANGSLIKNADNVVIGSRLLAQKFEQTRYFHARPSSCNYAGEASGGTNLGPTSDKLINGFKDDPSTKQDESFVGIKQLAQRYRQENMLEPNVLIPIDAVTRSGSGLDPDISEANAMLQVERIAKARGRSKEDIASLIQKNLMDRDLAILGEPHLRVLQLNLALDQTVHQVADTPGI